MRLRFAIVLSCLAALPGTPRAQTATPPPLYSTAAAFDPVRGRLVTFGGFGNRGYSGDTWEWDGKKWTSIAGAAPPQRDHVSMDYDAANKRLVMTGGHKPGGGQLDDMWQRVGARWSRVEARGTPALAAHHVIYDAKASRVLVFGGFGPGQGPTANIWAFTHGAWATVR